MKKILLLPITALLLAACEDAPKNELEAQENIAENIESGEIYGPVDYNDGLLAEAMLLDVKMVKLEDLDDRDVPSEEMKAACKEAHEEQNRVVAALTEIEPYGIKGEEFRQIVIEYVNSAGNFFDLYHEFSDLLSTPDVDWTQEAAELWDSKYNLILDEYQIANDNFIAVQEEYANLNNMDLNYDVSTAEEIYEESVEIED